MSVLFSWSNNANVSTSSQDSEKKKNVRWIVDSQSVSSASYFTDQSSLFLQLLFLLAGALITLLMYRILIRPLWPQQWSDCFSPKGTWLLIEFTPTFCFQYCCRCDRSELSVENTRIDTNMDLMPNWFIGWRSRWVVGSDSIIFLLEVPIVLISSSCERILSVW